MKTVLDQEHVLLEGAYKSESLAGFSLSAVVKLCLVFISFVLTHHAVRLSPVSATVGFDRKICRPALIPTRILYDD